jgi:hypothetical protein
MCIIIDADLAHKVFGVPLPHEYVPLWNWLTRKDGRIVFGGLNSRQLEKNKRAKEVILEWNRKGIAIGISGVDEEQELVEAGAHYESNDPHIIALARLSGARILCSRDKKLHKDFTNPGLLTRPRGKIYQNAEHRNVLKHSRGCQYP